MGACGSASVGRLLAWLWEKGYQLPKPERRGDYAKYTMVDANYTCLVHMLQNPKYAGLYVYPRVRRRGCRTVRLLRLKY